MKSRTRPEETVVIKRLSVVGEENIYYFHKENHLTPAQMGRVIRKYVKAGIITKVDNNIQLTEKGKAYIVNNRKRLFLMPKNRFWANEIHRYKGGRDVTVDFVIELNKLLEEGI